MTEQEYQELKNTIQTPPEKCFVVFSLDDELVPLWFVSTIKQVCHDHINFLADRGQDVASLVVREYYWNAPATCAVKLDS